MTDIPTWTVKSLKAALDAFDDNLPVVLAGDEEGNHFRTLASVEEAPYERDGSRVEVLHPDDAEEDMPKCVCLWP